MSNADEHEGEPTGEVSEVAEESEQPADVKKAKNGTAMPGAREEMPRVLSRFERYFEKPVSIQLKTPVVWFDYSGQTMMMQTARGSVEYGMLQLAMTANDAGNREAVGRTLLIPNAILMPYGDALLAWVTSPSGATIEISIDPANIEFVSFVARLPQAQNLIVS